MEALQRDPAGHFLLAGEAWTGTQAFLGAWLVRIQDDGAVDWQRNSLLPGRPSSILPGPDGRFVLGCGARSSSASRLIVAQFESDGHLNSACASEQPVELRVHLADVASSPDAAAVDTDVAPVTALSLVTAIPPSLMPCAGCSEDEFAPNEAPDDAHDWPEAAPALSVSSCTGSGDWFSFAACVGETQVFETSRPGPACDSLLQVFERDGLTLLAEAGAPGGEPTARLAWTAPRSGRFLLRVSQADGEFGEDRTTLLTRQVTPAGETWSLLIGSGAHDAVAEAVPARGDGAFLAGASGLLSPPGPDAGIWLSHLRADGALGWSRAIAPDDAASLSSLAPLRDGGLLVSASRSPSFNAWMARFGADGGLRWQVTSSDWLGSGSCELGDGTLVLVGGRRATRFDADGLAIWQLQADLTDANLTAVAPAADGGFLALGDIREAGLSSTDGWLVRFDELGTVLWNRLLPGADRIQLASATELADGRWVVAGTAADAEHAGLLFVLDETGTLVEAWRLTGPGGPRLRSLHETVAGEFILAGELAEPPGSHVTTDILVAKLDPTLNLEWSRAAGHAPDDRAAAAVELADGRVLLLGTGTPLLENSSGWALALDGADGLGPPCSELTSYPLRVEAETIALVDSVAVFASLAASSSPADWTLTGVAPTIRSSCDCDCPAEVVFRGEVSRPGSSQPLVFDGPGRLRWESPAFNGACTCDVYRARLDLVRLGVLAGFECLKTGLSASTVALSDFPPSGGGYAYLVSGRALGTPGPPGSGSTGWPRGSLTPCP